MVQLYLYEAVEKARKTALEAVASFATGSKKKNYNRVVNVMLRSFNVNPKELRRSIAQAVIKAGKYDF